jgi:hypothetical protein
MEAQLAIGERQRSVLEAERTALAERSATLQEQLQSAQHDAATLRVQQGDATAEAQARAERDAGQLAELAALRERRPDGWHRWAQLAIGERQLGARADAPRWRTINALQQRFEPMRRHCTHNTPKQRRQRSAQSVMPTAF